VALVLFGAVALLWQPRRDDTSTAIRDRSDPGARRRRGQRRPDPQCPRQHRRRHEHPPLLSDADGRFAFLALPAGTFTLSVSKAGSRRPRSARTHGRGRNAIRVADGAVVDDVVVALPRGAAIAGIVVDDTGEPVPGASVMIERDGARSRATPAVPIVGMTDEAGRYRIGSLGAGPVLVSVFAAARSIVMLPGGGVMSGATIWVSEFITRRPEGRTGDQSCSGRQRTARDRFVTPANVPIGPASRRHRAARPW